MNEVELPPVGVGVVQLLVSAPFLLLALRKAGRMLPRHPVPSFRWRTREAAAIVVSPFVAAAVLGALLSPSAPAAPVEGAVAAEPSMLLQLVASQLVLGVAALLAVFLAGRRAGGLAALGLPTGAPLRAFLAVPLVYVPLFLFAAGLANLWIHLSRALGWPEQQEVMQAILGLGGGELALAVVLAVVIGPLVEEVVFRGFLLSLLVQLGGPVVGFLLTALLFALLHGVAGLPTLFALSLFLCWLQVRTRSVWPSYLAHALNNGVTLGLALALVAQ